MRPLLRKSPTDEAIRKVDTHQELHPGEHVVRSSDMTTLQKQVGNRALQGLLDRKVGLFSAIVSKNHGSRGAYSKYAAPSKGTLRSRLYAQQHPTGSHNLIQMKPAGMVVQRFNLAGLGPLVGRLAKEVMKIKLPTLGEKETDEASSALIDKVKKALGLGEKKEEKPGIIEE
jgi:hypothetical protein